MEAGQATWNEYKEIVRASRKETRKAKGQDLNLGKDNKVGFLKHINRKRKSKDNVSPLLNGGENPGNRECRESRVTKCLFCIGHCTGKTSPQEFLI